MSGDRKVPFLGLCGAEWRKIRGRGLVWAVLLFGFVHGLLAPLLIKLILILGDRGEVDRVDWLVGGDLALFFAIFPVHAFGILLLAAILWAEDFSLGTMAMIFVRPVARWKVFASKGVVAWGVGLMSLSLALVTGLALGAVLLGFSGDVGHLYRIYPVGWMAEAPASASALPTALGAGTRLLHILQTLGVGVLLLGPVVALAAFVASVARSPVWTLSGAMVLLVVDAFLFVFTAGWGKSTLRYNDVAAALSEWTISGCWWVLIKLRGSADLFAEGWQAMLVTGGWTVLLGGLALWLFLKRDVT